MASVYSENIIKICGIKMNTKYALETIERLEEEMKTLKERVNAVLAMQEQLNEVDERTRQFKRYTQTDHPDD